MNTAKRTALSLSLGLLSLPVMADNHLVLVHGAHFDGQSWQKVVAQLPSDFTVHTPNLPGRSHSENAKEITLDSSAKALCADLSKLSGPIHLAGHSQGGAIINHAIGHCEQVEVASITYITAVAPVEGESAFDSLSKQDGDNYMKSMEYHKESARMKVKEKRIFAEYFAQDASEDQKQTVMGNAINEPTLIAYTPIAYGEKMSTIPKNYVFASDDQIISLASQLKIASQWPIESVYSVQSGHLPMLTQAKPLADILEIIVNKY